MRAHGRAPNICRRSGSSSVEPCYSGVVATAEAAAATFCMLNKKFKYRFFREGGNPPQYPDPTVDGFFFLLVQVPPARRRSVARKCAEEVQNLVTWMGSFFFFFREELEESK